MAGSVVVAKLLPLLRALTGALHLPPHQALRQHLMTRSARPPDIEASLCQGVISDVVAGT